MPSDRRFAWLWRDHQGTTAIEMAFVLPICFLFLFAIEEFGRMLWTQVSLQYASATAARCAAVSPSLCTASGSSTMDVPSYAASQAFGLSIPANTFTYTPNATCGKSGGAEVTASYAFPSAIDLSGLFTTLGMTKGSNPLNVTLTARSCHF